MQAPKLLHVFLQPFFEPPRFS